MNTAQPDNAVKLFLLLFPLCCAGTTNINLCDYNVKLSQMLHNEGFHRNLTYYIKYVSQNVNHPYHGCSVGLELVLPSGVYASPDQIANSKSKTIAIFKSNVNTESPAHEADPIIMHLLGKVHKDTAVLSLPVHARYHEAVAGGGNVDVELATPRLYLNCGKNTLEKCEEEPPEIPAVNHFCTNVPLQRCLWRESLIQTSDGPPAWSVPAGDTGHGELVALLTGAALAGGSLHLLRALLLRPPPRCR